MQAAEARLVVLFIRRQLKRRYVIAATASKL